MDSLSTASRAALCLALLLPACKPPQPVQPKEATDSVAISTATPPPPTPTPPPAPTPLFIQRKSMETAQLYNGIELRTTLEHAPGGHAVQERKNRAGYAVEVNVKVTVPEANRSLEALSEINPHLSTLLPGLATMLPEATVSPDFEELYARKLRFLRNNLSRLEQLLSRHNFYDCETILDLTHPETGQPLVLLQSEMDIDTDGSDGDRVPNPEGKDRFFQPMTSYHWPKQTEVPNPFLSKAEEKLNAVQEELKLARGKKGDELARLRNRLGSARYEVNQLRNRSFLISETDPFIVLPSFILNKEAKGKHTPRLGDYAVVIFNDVLYPAIVGDAGPSFKSGEASFRFARQLNPRSSLLSRPVSDLKVTYLIFPGSADAEPGPPDLDRWRTRVDELLNRVGGYTGTLFAWETIAKPAPTPTPEPSPTPEVLLVEGGAAQLPTTATSSPEATPTPGAELPLTVPLPTASPVPSATPVANELPVGAGTR